MQASDDCCERKCAVFWNVQEGEEGKVGSEHVMSCLKKGKRGRKQLEERACMSAGKEEEKGENGGGGGGGVGGGAMRMTVKINAGRKFCVVEHCRIWTTGIETDFLSFLHWWQQVERGTHCFCSVG